MEEHVDDQIVDVLREVDVSIAELRRGREEFKALRRHAALSQKLPSALPNVLKADERKHPEYERTDQLESIVQEIAALRTSVGSLIQSRKCGPEMEEREKENYPQEVMVYTTEPSILATESYRLPGMIEKLKKLEEREAEMKTKVSLSHSQVELAKGKMEIILKQNEDLESRLSKAHIDLIGERSESEQKLFHSGEELKRAQAALKAAQLREQKMRESLQKAEIQMKNFQFSILSAMNDETFPSPKYIPVSHGKLKNPSTDDILLALQRAKEDVQIAEGKADAKAILVKELSAELEILVQEKRYVSDRSTTRTSLIEEKKDLENALLNLQNETDALKNELEKHKTQILSDSEQRAAFSRLEREVLNHRSTLKTCKSKSHTIQSECTGLATQLKELKTAFEIRYTNLLENYNRRKDEISATKLELKDMNETSAIIRVMIKNAKKEVIHLESQLGSFERSADEAGKLTENKQCTILDKESNVQLMQSELAHLKEEKQALAHDLKVSKRSRLELSENIISEEARQGFLRKSLRNAERELQQYQETIELESKAIKSDVLERSKLLETLQSLDTQTHELEGKCVSLVSVKEQLIQRKLGAVNLLEKEKERERILSDAFHKVKCALDGHKDRYEKFRKIFARMEVKAKAFDTARKSLLCLSQNANIEQANLSSALKHEEKLKHKIARLTYHRDFFQDHVNRLIEAAGLESLKL